MNLELVVVLQLTRTLTMMFKYQKCLFHCLNRSNNYWGASLIPY